MSKPHYENHDALLQLVIGGIAVIIFNVLSHFNLISFFFGLDTDPFFVTQTLTIFIMAIITWFLVRFGRPKNPPSSTPPSILPSDNAERPDYDKPNTMSRLLRLLQHVHFHYPIIFKPLFITRKETNKKNGSKTHTYSNYHSP